MWRSRLVLFALALLSAGCSTRASRLEERATAALSAKDRAKIERGVVEPGFTPEMVYLALGRPLSPSHIDVAGTQDATWIYRGFPLDPRDFVRGGFRQRTVFDPVRRSDVVITEPVDARLYPHLQIPTTTVIFRAGRVTEVQHGAL